MYQLTLTKEDFLRFHLFTASKSKKVKKQRLVSWIAMTVVILCLSGMFALGNDLDFALSLLIVAAISAIFTPIYLKWRYKKFFEKHVTTHYKNRIEIPCDFSFIDGFIFSKDKSSEGKVKLEEIEVVNEIAANLFVKMKGGFTFIFPANMNEYGRFKSELQSLTKNLNILWNVELNWKW